MTINYEKKDKIAYVTLNRPEAMNALNNAMLKELRRIFEDFNSDPESLVAIITGKGEKAFCAGFDLQEVSKGLFDDPFQLKGQQEARETAHIHLGFPGQVIDVYRIRLYQLQDTCFLGGQTG